MNISIREANGADIDALIHFHGRFMEHHRNCDERFEVRAGEQEKWRERISVSVRDAETLVLIAETDSESVGCAYTLIRNGAMDFGPEKIGYLCGVFVDSRYRRQGLARRFLSISLEWLHEREIYAIEASWAVRCNEAQETWCELGFEPISISGRLVF